MHCVLVFAAFLKKSLQSLYCGVHGRVLCVKVASDFLPDISMPQLLQFVVEDIGRYNYNGEIQDKLLEMSQPNLVKIRQKQVCSIYIYV